MNATRFTPFGGRRTAAKIKNTEIVDKLREKGLFTSPAEDNLVRITPPLIIEEKHVEEAVNIIKKICEEGL